MIIVADTSPLNYLVQIEAVQILPALYGRILVPPQVLCELNDAQAPAAVRAWLSAPPAWLEVKRPTRTDPSLHVHEGEAAAIALAFEVKADRLLIDEQDGRAAARQLGIPVAGTLAVLKDAASAGLLDLAASLKRLQQTNFRASATLYREILAAYRK